MPAEARGEGLEAYLVAWQRGGGARREVISVLSQREWADWGPGLIASGQEGRRLVAAALGAWAGEAEEALAVLRQLAGDPDRRTRELAAQAAGAWLARAFEEVYPILGMWRGDPQAWVRRAVPLAVAAGARPEHLEWADPLLRLLEPLLSDRAPEVKTALGPRVLAHHLSSLYPEDTFEHLAYWSTSYDEQVLWHVAWALSGPAAARRARRALILLRKLALDERRYVRGAVASAVRQLGKLAPDPVLAELKGWLGDETRAPVARAALRGL